MLVVPIFGMLGLIQAPAVGAEIEPDRTATLDRADPAFTWESLGSGVPDPFYVLGEPQPFRCTGTPFNCDYTLLQVKRAGALTLTLDNTSGVKPEVDLGANLQDIDGYIYRSNAAGEPLREALTPDCATSSPSESCKIVVEPGFYLIEVEYWLAWEASYVGTAELSALRSARPKGSRR